MDQVKHEEQFWSFGCEVDLAFYHTYLLFLPLSTPDLGRDPLVSGKQVVEIKHTLKEPRSLADPVRTTGHTRELHLRDVCWKQANGELRKISPLLHVFCYVYEILGQTALRTGYVNCIHALNIVYFPLSKPQLHFLVHCHLARETVHCSSPPTLQHVKKTNADIVVQCDIFSSIHKTYSLFLINQNKEPVNFTVSF